MKRTNDGLFRKKESIVDNFFSTIRQSKNGVRERVLCNNCFEERDRNIKRMLYHVINCPQKTYEISNEDMKKVKEEIMNLNSNKQVKPITTLYDLFPYATPTQTTRENLNLL